MPGLLRGIARTAVIAGTASAVSGRVQRRQAEHFAGRDAHIYAQRDRAYAQQAPRLRAAGPRLRGSRRGPLRRASPTCWPSSSSWAT